MKLKKMLNRALTLLLPSLSEIINLYLKGSHLVMEKLISRELNFTKQGLHISLDEEIFVDRVSMET